MSIVAGPGAAAVAGATAEVLSDLPQDSVAVAIKAIPSI
jgi:hypothetical protein